MRRTSEEKAAIEFPDLWVSLCFGIGGSWKKVGRKRRPKRWGRRWMWGKFSGRAGATDQKVRSEFFPFRI